MEVSRTPMEATLEATMASLSESRALLASCARRLGVKEKEGKVASTTSCASLTCPLYVPGRVREQPVTKSSSSWTISAYRVEATGASYTDTYLAIPTPTRCLTIGSAVNDGGNHALAAFPTSGTKHIPATTWRDAGKNGMQGASGTGMNLPAGCSSHVLTNPQEGFVDGAHAVNTGQLGNNYFPRFDGTNPGLSRERCLEYFTEFNICNPFWTIAAIIHMDDKAKEWLEAYRLRQVVGDWSEFMDAVEENFGVCDFHQKLQVQLLPPETLVVISTSLVFDGIPNMSVSMASEADDIHLLSHGMQEWISQHPVDNAPHDTYEQHMVSCEAILGDMANLAESLVKEDSQEILTDIGSSSLFLEHVMDAVDEVTDAIVLDEVWMSDEVLTHVGGISIFLELCVHTVVEAFEESVDATNCLDRLLDKVDTTNCLDRVLDKVPPWRLSGFSPRNFEHHHAVHLENIDSSINDEIMHQLFGITRVWDLGI